MMGWSMMSIQLTMMTLDVFNVGCGCFVVVVDDVVVYVCLK